ncbi:MAG: hypothetical protein HUJ27_17065 [Rhodobacteraceae bacterium]|nr:hypothetical protein [Paracoccaceae bacterium]
MSSLPPYYFRIRENGAAVFRVSESRQRRLEMDPIAVINIRNGEVKPQGGRELSEEDRTAIDAWITERTAELAARETDDIRRLIEDMNRAAHWAQTRATPEQLAGLSDDLLMAMHDLRSTLVRRAARDAGED